MQITLLGTPMTRSLRAAWALEEAGVDYRYRRIDLRAGEGRSPDFLNINPGGKVPVLEVELDDSTQTIPESAAIVTWIGEQFPDSGLVPGASSAERSQYFRWMVFAVAELEQPLWTLSKHSFALPEKHRVPEIADTARWEWSIALKVLAKGLGNRHWILGDTFSGADILLAHTLKWGTARAGALENEVLERYMDRAFSRPACRSAIDREKTAS